jgi:hypothetical protein
MSRFSGIVYADLALQEENAEGKENCFLAAPFIELWGPNY